MVESEIAPATPTGRHCAPEAGSYPHLESKAQASRKNAIWVIGLLVCLYSILGGLSVDLVLPAFPGIRRSFAIDTVAVQQILTCYLVAYACGCLVIGPLSDAFGRRPTLIAGLAIFTLASFAAILTDSYIILLVSRCVQGVGASAGKVVCRALVADRFDSVHAQKLLSAVTAMFLVAPALGPVVGGWLQTSYGWRSNFLFLALFSLATLVLYVAILRETHVGTGRSALQLGNMRQSFFTLARHRRFMLISITSGVCSAPMFLYVTSAPAVVLTHWSLGPSGYAWLSIPIAAGTLIGSMVCNRLSARVGRTKLASYALFSQIGFAATTVGVVWFAPEGYGKFAMLPIAMTAAASAAAFPVLMMTALDYAPAARGFASSLFNFVSLGLIALVGGLVAPLAAASALILAITAVGFSVVAAAFWVVARGATKSPRSA